MAKAHSYAKGDWIVHTYYGVGQVVRIEKKILNEEKTSCYHVITKDSTFWVPVDKVDNPRLRPVASKYQMRKAIKILKDTPTILSEDSKERRNFISGVRNDGALYAVSALLRDIRKHQTIKPLNSRELQTMEWATDRMVREWSISMGLEMDEAQSRLEDILKLIT